MTESNPSLPSSPALDYPRVLYVGVYRYRSWQGILAALVTGFMAFMFWYLPQSAHASRLDRRLFSVGTLFGGGVSLWMTIGIMMDFKEQFRLTTTGIESRRRFVPWGKVQLLAAKKPQKSGEIQLFYKERVVAGVVINRALVATRPMTKADYESLIELLKNELSTSYPDTDFGGYYDVDV